MRQRSQQAASAPPLSLEVEQTAAIYQLGMPDAGYQTKDERISSIAGVIWMVYIIVLISVVFFFFISGASHIWWLWLVWLFFTLILFLGIRFSIAALVSPHINVFVYAAGLVYQKKDRSEAIRWDQVEAYWKDISYDSESGYTYHYSLQLNNGAKFEFPDSIVEIQKLGEIIERNASQHIQPRSIAAYRAGATVDFGNISINQQEISVKGGRKRLVWDDFESFTLDDETLAFYRQGQKIAWHRQRIAQIASPKALQGLISHAAQDRVHQQLPRLIATYNTGSPIVFGRISISLQGISIDNGKQTLTWSDVRKIDVNTDERRVSISTYNKLLNWQTLHTDATPNALALKGLVDYALQKQRRQRDVQVQQQLPQMIASYDAGMPISFGRVTLSLQGVAVDNGKQFLPWTEVANIYVRMYIGGERLTVLKKGKTLAWQAIRTSETGDVELLKDLIEHIMGGHP